ncbi:MAG: tail fiber domain-containing protein [Bacteroidetes bacterium]|nr:tail fiber domain-containing protein [Bacteroidota bacterium]
MKKLYIIITILTVATATAQTQAQGIAIGTIESTSANANAILEIKSQFKGILLPRVSTAARLAIPNTKGLIVYDTTAGNYYYNTGTAWQTMAKTIEQPNTWLLNGNSGVSRSSFVGTHDSTPILLMVNGQNSGVVEPVNGNASLGYATGFFTDATFSNAIVGASSMAVNEAGGANTTLGSHTLAANTNGNGNTALGAMALNFNTEGFLNQAAGYASLQYMINGAANTAAGSGALHFATTGSNNTGIGFNALYSNDDANDNTGVGNGALFSNVHSIYNTAIGSDAMRLNTLSATNVAIGYRTLYFDSAGGENVAMGYFPMYRLKNGAFNVGIGSAAMYSSLNANAFYNTAIGYYALFSVSSTQTNVAVGYQADFNATTGFANTALGASTNMSAGTYSNSIALGADAIVTGSNRIRIGSASVTVIEGQVPFTTPSDGRFKYKIKEDVRGLDFILRLRPVTYNFDNERFDKFLRNDSSNVTQAAYHEPIRQTGFIAQEVERAAEASNYDFSGLTRPENNEGHYSLSYETFVVPLVKGMQEQQTLIEAQHKKIAALKKQLIEAEAAAGAPIEELEQKVAQLRELIKNLQSK